MVESGGVCGGGGGWKNDFSAICWRSHLDRYSTAIFCQEKIRGGEVELLMLKERERERNIKLLLRLTSTS